jgi:hypothetical protein
MLWQIYVRYPNASSEFAAECYQHGFVAIGWGDIGNLNNIDSKEQIKRAIVRIRDYEYTKNDPSLPSAVGTLLSFRDSIHSGDYVVCPDAKGNRFYIGRIASDYYFERKTDRNGCPFRHRRRVKWIRAVSHHDIESIWKSRPHQTVARLLTGESKLLHLLKVRKSSAPRRASGHFTKPDAVWGRKAELRAMEWLRKNGKKPVDVAEKCFGWDIECGGVKYEVKGRRDSGNLVRLTQNEFKAAKKFGRNYVLLLLTAENERELSKVNPELMPDPARTRDWSVHTIKEYHLDE